MDNENDAAKAAEIVKWWDSGVLPDGLVRAEAEQMLATGTADEMHYIRQAEQAIINRIVRRFAALTPETRP